MSPLIFLWDMVVLFIDYTTLNIVLYTIHVDDDMTITHEFLNVCLVKYYVLYCSFYGYISCTGNLEIFAVA